MKSTSVFSPASVWKRGARGRFAFLCMVGPIYFILRYLMGYKFKNLKECRQQYSELIRSGKGILLCSPHWTLADPFLNVVVVSTFWDLFTEYRRVPWNFAEMKHSGNPIFFLIYYFLKCFPVSRGASSEERAIAYEFGRFLLSNNQVFMLFPEGRRSQGTGIDMGRPAFGLDRIVAEIPDTTVMCLYLRGSRQTKKSQLPPRGSIYDLRWEISTVRQLRESNQEKSAVVGLLQKLSALEGRNSV
jgi:1-acyl-sn-glycerol-3-phosphate acyltransferase